MIEYLKTPPTAAQLKAILKKLGMKPDELVRKGEAIYKEQYAGKTLSDDEWIAAMVANPSTSRADERSVIRRMSRVPLSMARSESGLSRACFGGLCNRLHSAGCAALTRPTDLTSDFPFPTKLAAAGFSSLGHGQRVEYFSPPAR